MPAPYFTQQDFETIISELSGKGLSDEQIKKATKEIAARIVEERQAEEFGEKSTLGQAWWAAQRGFRGAGSVAGTIPGALLSLLAGRPGAIKSPIDVYQETIAQPFVPVPSPVSEEAPRAVQFGAQMGGSLMTSLPLMRAAFGGLGALSHLGAAPRAGILGKAAYAAGRPLAIAEAAAPRLTAVGKTGAVFEALGQLGGGPTGEGFVSGVALSAIPMFMTRSARFMPKHMPGGVTNPYALSTALRAGLMGGGAVTGLAVKDLAAGMSIPEQFDLSTPEGQSSLMSKALGFAFTAMGTAKQARRFEEAGKDINKELFKKAEEFYKGLKAESKALEVALTQAPKELSPKILKQRLARSPDRVLSKLAKTLKIEPSRDLMTPQEIEHLAARKTPAMLDSVAPERQIFTEQGRIQLLNNIYKAFPKNQAVVTASLAREKQAGELLYKFIHSTTKEIPKAPGPPPKGKPREGVWLDPTKKGYWQYRFKKVKIDPVTEAQRGDAHNLYKKLSAVLKTYNHVIGTREGLEATRLRSLREVLGVRVGDQLYKIASKFKPTELQLHDYMTAHQYEEYLRVFRGQASSLLRILEPESFRQTGQIRPVESIIQGAFETPLPTGVTENASVQQQVSDAGLSHYIRGTGMRMLRHQDKNPADPTGTLYYFLSEAQTKSHQFHQKIQLLQKWIWTKDLPAASMTRKWTPFRDYVAHQLAPKDAVAAGIKPLPIGEVAKVVKWAGTPQQLESIASGISTKLRTTYNWMFARNGMSMDRFRTDYMPLLRRWANTDMKIPLESYMVNQGLSKVDAKSFSELLRRLATPPSQRIVPGAKTPWYENPRKIDQEAAKLLTYEKNPIYALDKYARMLARRTIKEPLLPLAGDIVNQIRANHAGEPGGGRRVLQSTKWFLDSWWGQPSYLDRMTTGYHPLTKGYDWFREHMPGGRKLLPALNKDNYGGMRDFFDFVTTGAYGVTLGYNPTSILKNLTQSSHTVAVFGGRKWWKGMSRAIAEPKFRKQGEDLRVKIRTQYLDYTPAEVTKAQRAVAKFTKTGLSGFAWADRMNVNGAIYASLDSWQDAMNFLGKRKPTAEMKAPFLEKLNLRRMRWFKHLWQRYRRVPGLEKEYRQTYAGTKTLGDLVWKDVVAGKTDRALLQYSKFMTYLTQYAYGTPESAPAFRGSFNRLLFMYSSWPVNYAEFLSSMMNSRTGREWLRLAAFWLPFGTLAAAGGTKAYQWFGFGPYPTELTLQSPVLGVAGATYKAASTISRASQAWIFKAEDDYYLNNAPGQMLDTMEEFEHLVPFRRLYQAITPEEEEIF